MSSKDKTIVVEDGDGSVNKISVRIPNFWAEEPELWFAQLEGQFALLNIKEDEAKYSFVLSRIEPKQAREIKDLITRPPCTEKYQAIKKALIQRLTDSQSQRIRQLLEHEEIGDRKLSQFLRHLSTLAGDTVSKELLRTLWLGRLPQNMQAILATRSEDKLEDVAEQADRIHELSHKTFVLATSTQAPAENKKPWELQIAALSRQVAELTTEVTKMARNMNQQRPRSRQRSFSRDRSRWRSKSPASDGVCFYHRRFKDEARKCTKPCTFKAKNEEASH
ncbi:PREDICTED: uncharacterized protein LOC105456671 [Wasmannia auropunctata]|uniref:uncharacterized protein LOC105456671 n=1 Tax=Wasmannia auropunctata TaxID=64793 RepID=UPI0005F056F1|nr:PREDICTED: uncharacterized protein LOC105456671 [Wasmannia auropunctata]